jgi:DNA-binding Xre family transcriptional regulator
MCHALHCHAIPCVQKYSLRWKFVATTFGGMEELTRIQALLRLPSTKIDEVSKITGISRRNLFLIKGGKTSITLGTLNKLRAWGKGRRLPSESKQ